MSYNPQESLENTINTMGTLLGVHPIVPGLKGIETVHLDKWLGTTLPFGSLLLTWEWCKMQALHVCHISYMYGDIQWCNCTSYRYISISLDMYKYDFFRAMYPNVCPILFDRNVHLSGPAWSCTPETIPDHSCLCIMLSKSYLPRRCGWRDGFLNKSPFPSQPCLPECKPDSGGPECKRAPYPAPVGRTSHVS